MTTQDIKNKHGHDCDILYKESINEPYVPSGEGIAGGVIYNEQTDEVMCNECGWFGESLGKHIQGKHKNIVDVKEYKFKHGLFQKTALVSKRLSRIYSKNASQDFRKERLTAGLKNKSSRKLTERSNGKAVMAYKNKSDMCPLQRRRRLRVIMLMCEYAKLTQINSTDIERLDRRLYNYFQNNYPTLKDAFDDHDLLYIQAPPHHMARDEELIADLRTLVFEIHKIPTGKELGKFGLPAAKTYVNHFGSWRRAKLLAGLTEVLLQERQAKAISSLY